MDLPDGGVTTEGSRWPHFSLPVMLLGSASLLCITSSLIALIVFLRTKDPIEFHMATGSSGVVAGSSAISLYIDIAGAVNYPGVYAMPDGSRVDDVITKAGGVSSYADTGLIGKTINRASRVKDGMKIYIPFHIPENQIGNTTLGSKTPVTEPHVVNSVVSINSATLSELDGLPGVGPVIGQKIISGRPYGSVDELITKKVMSESLLGKLRDAISL